MSAYTVELTALAGRQVGAVIVNRVRLLLSTTLLMLLHYVQLGSFLPISATPECWLWLGMSGIVGLVVGDAFLFQAFIWIELRLSMLMMSLAPVLATILVWSLLDEILNVCQIFGILLTLSGIIWVIQERGKPVRLTATNPYLWCGILFGV